LSAEAAIFAPRGKKTGNFAANSFGKPIFCSIHMLQNMGAARKFDNKFQTCEQPRFSVCPFFWRDMPAAVIFKNPFCLKVLSVSAKLKVRRTKRKNRCGPRPVFAFFAFVF